MCCMYNILQFKKILRKTKFLHLEKTEHTEPHSKIFIKLAKDSQKNEALEKMRNHPTICKCRKEIFLNSYYTRSFFQM